MKTICDKGIYLYKFPHVYEIDGPNLIDGSLEIAQVRKDPELVERHAYVNLLGFNPSGMDPVQRSDSAYPSLGCRQIQKQ